MIDKFSSSKPFKLIRMFFLSTFLITLLLPIVNAPLHGDDLISPFNYYLEFDGKIRNYLLNFSLSFDGHFNFLGEIFSVLWIDFWISILVKTNSIYQFIMAYRILKILVMLLFLSLAIKLNRMVFPNLKLGLTALYTFISFLIVTVYHTNWSSDPVGNYPLTGYLSTSIGLIYIILLQSKKLDNRIYINLTIILLAILYYEINLALIAVLIYYYRTKLGTKKIVNIVLALVFITLCSYLVLLSPNAYLGGQLSVSWRFFYSFLLQLFSIFPPITFPLAIYFSKSTIISSIIFCGVLILISRQIMKTFIKSKPEQKALTIIKEFLVLNSIERLLLLYFVGGCLIIALTQKYQNEIYVPGQVYMSYSSGQLFLIIFVSRIIIKYYQITKIEHFIALIVLASSISFQNYIMVQTLNERTQYTQGVLYSWDSNKNLRCASIRQFYSYNLDKEYMNKFDKSFRKIYYDLKMQPFC